MADSPALILSLIFVRQIFFAYSSIKEMSSVARAPQVTSQGDAFFVNLTTFWPEYHTLDACGNLVEVNGIEYNGNSYAPGAMFLRDMGKTIRVPGQTIDAQWNGSPRCLRKVQFVAQATGGGFPVTNHFIGFNEGVAGASDVFQGALPSGFTTLYIDLNDQNDSANRPKVRFARMSVQ